MVSCGASLGHTPRGLHSGPSAAIEATSRSLPSPSATTPGGHSAQRGRGLAGGKPGPPACQTLTLSAFFPELPFFTFFTCGVEQWCPQRLVCVVTELLPGKCWDTRLHSGLTMGPCLIVWEKWILSSCWDLALAYLSSLCGLCSLPCPGCGGRVSYCISSKLPGLCFSAQFLSWPFVHPRTLSSAISLEEWMGA